jgi:hypothetical protein
MASEVEPVDIFNKQRVVNPNNDFLFRQQDHFDLFLGLLHLELQSQPISMQICQIEKKRYRQPNQNSCPPSGEVYPVRLAQCRTLLVIIQW